MPTQHTVVEGDSVISLSEQYGLFALTIWNDPGNNALRELRSDMNTLMPGDVVVIPDKTLKFEKRATGQKYKFRRKGIPALFRLQVFYNHIPRANEAYTLTVDGAEQSGVTDGKGILEKYIPAGSKQGELVIGEDQFRVRLQFGYLDPGNEISGVQKRLNNLGYDCGTPDGKMSDLFRNALLAFQRSSGLELTGEADDATQAKLAAIHDQPYTYPDDDGTGAGASA